MRRPLVADGSGGVAALAAAAAHMRDAVGRGGNLIGAADALRGFQAGVNEYAAYLRARLALKETQQNIHLYHIGGGLHFGQRYAVEMRACDCLQVVAGYAAFKRVDAHEERLAGAAEFVYHLGDDLAGGVFFLRRHGVF